LIVVVRLKPTGALGWIARSLGLRKAADSGPRGGRIPGSVPLPAAAHVGITDRVQTAGRFDTLARKLGTAIVGITMCAVTAADGTVVSFPRTQPPVFRPDPRIAKLEAFFDGYRCPAPRHVADYLRVADTYKIDYRLLPALSVRETTCGQYQTMNNRWGWASGRNGFASIPAGIEYVGRQLAEARQFKGKSLDQKLWTYNPRAAYPGEIKKLMRKIEE
jgi:hypothetical protein